MRGSWRKFTQKKYNQRLNRAICLGVLFALGTSSYALAATTTDWIYTDTTFADGDKLEVTGGDQTLYQAIYGFDTQQPLTITINGDGTNGGLTVVMDNQTTNNTRNTQGIFANKQSKILMTGDFFTVQAKGNGWTCGLLNDTATMELGKDDAILGKISVAAHSVNGEADGISNSAGTTDFYEAAVITANSDKSSALGIWQSAGDLSFHGAADIRAQGEKNTYAIKNGKNDSSGGTIHFAAGDKPVILQANSVSQEAMGIFNFRNITFDRSAEITAKTTATELTDGHPWAAWGILNDGGMIQYATGTKATLRSEGGTAYGLNSRNSGQTRFGDLSIAATATQGSALGIYHEYDNSTQVSGTTDIQVNSASGQAQGVWNYWGTADFQGQATINANANADIALGINNESYCSVTFGDDAQIAAVSQQAGAYGIQTSGPSGIVTLNGMADIKATGADFTVAALSKDGAELYFNKAAQLNAAANNAEGWALDVRDGSIVEFAAGAALTATSQAAGKYDAVGISNTQATVNFKDATAAVTIKAEALNGQAFGISNLSDSALDFAGTATVQAKGSYGMAAANNGTLKFSQTAVLNGEAVGSGDAFGLWNAGSDATTTIFSGAAELTAKSTQGSANGLLNECGTVTFADVDQTAKITATSIEHSAFGVYNCNNNGANVLKTIFNGAAEINASGGTWDSISVYNDGGTFQFDKTATLKAWTQSNGENAMGIMNTQSGAIVFNDQANIEATAGNGDKDSYVWGVLNKELSTIAFANGADITVNLTGTNVSNTSFGTRNQGGKVSFNGKPVTITVNAQTGEAYGVINNIVEADSNYGHTLFQTDAKISAQGSAAQGVWNEKGTTFFYHKADIAAIANDPAKRALGVQADNGGSVKFFGDTTILAQAADPAEAYALLATNQGEIVVNNNGAKQAVQITGHLKASTDGKITLVLDSANASLDGLVFAETGGMVDLTLQNGGAWRPTGDQDISMEQLQLKGQGIVDMTAFGKNSANGKFRSLRIGTLNGSNGIFKIDTDLKNLTGDKLVLNQVTNGSKYYLLITDASMDDAANNYISDQALEVVRLEDQTGKQLTMDTIPVIKGDYQYKIILREATVGDDKVWSFNDLGSTKKPPIIPPDPTPEPEPDPDPIPPDPTPEVPNPPDQPEATPGLPVENTHPFPMISSPTVNGSVSANRSFLDGSSIVPSKNDSYGVGALNAGQTVKIEIGAGANGLIVQVENNATDPNKVGMYAGKGAALTVVGGDLHVQAYGTADTTAISNSGIMSFGDPQAKLGMTEVLPIRKDGSEVTIDNLLQSGNAIGAQTNKAAETKFYQDTTITVKTNKGMATGVINRNGLTDFTKQAIITTETTDNYAATGASNTGGHLQFMTAKVQVDSLNGTAVGIDNNVATAQTDFTGKAEINVAGNGEAYGVNNGGTLNFAEANIQVTNKSEKTKPLLFGVKNAAAGTLNFAESAVIHATANKGSAVGVHLSHDATVNFAKAAQIVVQGDRAAHGIYAFNRSSANLNGAVNISVMGDAVDQYALYTTDTATINVNQNGATNTVKLLGDIKAEGSSTINIMLNTKESVLKGLVSETPDSKVNLSIQSGGTWQPTGAADVELARLELNKDGIVDMGLAGTTLFRGTLAPYRSLSIGKLTGQEGIFKLYTDLANQQGDKLLLNDGGKQYLLITDKGMNASGDNVDGAAALEVVRLKDESGKNLQLSVIPVTRGEWEYRIDLDEKVEGSDRIWSFDDLGPINPLDPPVDPPVDPPLLDDVPGPGIPDKDTTTSQDRIVSDATLNGFYKVDSTKGDAAIQAAGNTVNLSVTAAGATLRTHGNATDGIAASMTGIRAEQGGTVTVTGGDLNMLNTGDTASIGIDNQGGTVTVDSKLNIEVLLSAGAATGIENSGATHIGSDARITVKSLDSAANVRGIEQNGGTLRIDGTASVAAYGKGHVSSVVNTAGDLTFAKDATVKAQSVQDGAANGVLAQGGRVSFEGNTDIEAKAQNGESHALLAQNGGTIAVNATGGNAVRIVGNVSAEQNGKISLTLDKKGSLLQGLVQSTDGGTVELTLKNGGTWNPTGTADVAIDALVLDKDGIVDMGLAGQTLFRSTLAPYRSLTVGKLTGQEGIFKLYTDLANQQGDKLILNDGGKQYLLITDKGMNTNGDNVDGAAALEVVRLKDESGKNLQLSVIPVTRGEWEYRIDLDDKVEGSDRIWSFDDLNPVFDGTKPSPEVSYRDGDLTAAESTQSLYGAFAAENNALSKSLRDLRHSGDQGIWARVQTGKQEISGRRSADNTYNAVQVGYDRGKATANGGLYGGIAIGHIRASNSYTHGDGETSSTSLAAYGSWQGNGGHYADLSLRHGWMKTSYTSNYLYYDEDQDGLVSRVDGDYKAPATQLSFAYGYRHSLSNGWHVTPQIGFAVGRIGSAAYTDSTGRPMRADGVDSRLLQLGFELGREFGATGREGKFYFRGSVQHEFDGEVRLRAGSIQLTEDLGGTYYALGLGVAAKVSDSSSLYLDLERTTGGKVTKPWAISAGVRYTF